MKAAYKFGKYYLYHQKSLQDKKFDDSSSMIWLIIKYLDVKSKIMQQNSNSKNNNNRQKIIDKNINRYPLTVGEIIKFGRAAYKITKIFIPNSETFD